jgi:hypothetical protein
MLGQNSKKIKNFIQRKYLGRNYKKTKRKLMWTAISSGPYVTRSSKSTNRTWVRFRSGPLSNRVP